MSIRVKPAPKTLTYMRTGSRQRKNTRFMILALSPAWLFLAALIGYPLIKVLTDAFQKAHLVNTSIGGFIGLDKIGRAHV